jgi:hypothetical protein
LFRGFYFCKIFRRFSSSGGRADSFYFYFFKLKKYSFIVLFHSGTAKMLSHLEKKRKEKEIRTV